MLDGVGEEMQQCDGKPKGQPTGQSCLLGEFYAAELNLNTLTKTLQWRGKGHSLFLLSIYTGNKMVLKSPYLN